MTEYFRIGKLVASHGLKGELVLQHSLGKKTSLKGLKAIFLETGPNSFLPYFIEHTSIRSDDETILKLEGVSSKESARVLTPKEVWLREEDFNQYKASTAPISLLGFSIIHGKENLGEIIEVIEQPHQVLCSIRYRNAVALIPVHEQSLLKMDQRNRKIYVDIPDGLLELYGE